LQIKHLKKSIGALALLAAFSGNSQAAECGEVSITEMDWDSARVVTAVAKFLMEQGYGCSVTTVPSASTPALASLAETGKPDILTEVWTNGAPAYNGLVESGKIEPLTEVLSDGGVEAWWVPTYLVEKHPELATLEGVLANPELVGGRFHNCPVGWTCQIINTNMAKAYPMTQVDIGPHDAATHECNSLADCATPKAAAYPKSIVTTVVSDTFAAGNPEVTDLMRNLAFTNTQMGELLAWKEDNNASADEAAVQFLTNYKDVWPAWLGDDAKAKLSALTQ